MSNQSFSITIRIGDTETVVARGYTSGLDLGKLRDRELIAAMVDTWVACPTPVVDGGDLS